ncbi:TetR/AcrR family transcriptional regulator [Paroceanicella profunda]|uniref:TetR/AcrR family transcriptional regulator n=1 Tax=Paroceanicella profunda TaxID=2579971 RepID=A0A5B8G0F0_9RHOB|nr:TetR/AcrR family transcriptional regulator [Paroceanicella profunda]QDL91943.1 TetR/AcrR family transcriptional regulator [Paroceanicella profunda]
MARPRAEDYEEKRAAIHRTAARLLSQGGGQASMMRIAEACGISKALLYHYYDSRDALVFDIVHTHLLALDAALAAVPPETRGRARLHLLSRRLLACYEDADDLHLLQLGAVGSLPDVQVAAIRAAERAILGHFRAALGDTVPGADRARTTAALMGLMGMLNWAFTWFRPDGALSRDGFAALATDMALSALQGAPATG